jgi:uncharacterized NAD-dependent epimerase/dehydratase family protein
VSAATRRYAILAPAAFATRSAKTAHGVIAYAADTTVAVIDPTFAGKTVREVVPYLASDAPIVENVACALAFAPTSLLVGIAPAGGALPPEMRIAILDAITAGLEIVSGLHQFLADDAEFGRAAHHSGVRIWDVRRPPVPRLFDGSAYDVAPPVVLTVGTDGAVGKMTASLELVRAARARGTNARFVATGQTGIMIAGGGTAIDGVVSDFATGAVEELVASQATPGVELLLVEGQGGINHPAFAPVTLALVFGAAPDALVLVHRAAASTIETYGTPMLAPAHAVAHYEAILATVKPARVAGVALNTQGLDEAAARRAIDDVRAQTGLPCDDLVRFGAHALYDAMSAEFASKKRPLAG